MTVHAPQPPPPQPYLVPVNLTEVTVKEATRGLEALRPVGGAVTSRQKKRKRCLKDTLLPEEGQQRGFGVRVVLRHLFQDEQRGNISVSFTLYQTLIDNIFEMTVI